jgi:sulfhydrogenase subunit beta (sulfur reductase)
VARAGDQLRLAARTPGGQELLDAAEDLTEPARPETDERAESLLWAAEERIAPVTLRGLPEALAGPIDPAVWRELGEVCRGCAVCTVLCPAATGDPEGGGPAVRGWSPAGRGLRAGGATGTSPARRRAAWWEDRVRTRFGGSGGAVRWPSCVGCGRCVRHCPAGLDLRAVLRKLRGSG